MRKQIGFVALAALAAVGCGGDDGGGEGDLAAYCELVEDSESNDGFPSEEEIEDVLDVTPAEIRDDVETLTDALRDLEDPDDVEALIEALEEPEVAEAIEDIEAFDRENCDTGRAPDDDDADAEADDEAEATTTTLEDGEDQDDEDGDEGGDEGAAGDTLCAEITDEQVSELLGVELSSAETLFNDEDNCTYEGPDGEELFLGRLDDIGQRPQDFLSNAEINFDDFEELEDVDADAAYFITSEFSGAMAGALGDGLVHSVTWDDGGDDPLANRDVVIELLELLMAT